MYAIVSSTWYSILFLKSWLWISMEYECWKLWMVMDGFDELSFIKIISRQSQAEISYIYCVRCCEYMRRLMLAETE